MLNVINNIDSIGHISIFSLTLTMLQAMLHDNSSILSNYYINSVNSISYYVQSLHLDYIEHR